MNHDKIMEMARKAELFQHVPPTNHVSFIYDLMEFTALVNAEKDTEIAVLQKALDAALDFAGTVGNSSSWWEEIWAEHEAAIDAARSEK